MRIKSSHIAILLSIAALAVSLYTFFAPQTEQSDYAARMEALEAQNQALQARIDALTGQIESPALGTAALTAAGWTDGRGADITLTLTPDAYADGDTAAFRALLGGAVVAEADCQWNGSAFTAVLPVPAGNGYTYTVTTGGVTHIVSSPDSPVYPELVDLADALSAYCNMILGDWYVRDEVLTLETGYVHIQTPQLGGDSVTCVSARAVLKNDGAVLGSSEIPLAPGECGGSYECALTDLTLSLPTLEEGQQADLWLEAELSSGQILTTCAGTWYAMPGGWSMAAG